MFRFVRRGLYDLFKYRFIRENVVESAKLAWIHFMFCFVVWLLIMTWVLFNKGVIVVNHDFKATNFLRIISNKSFETNYSKKQFNFHIEPEEYGLYNRIWDVDDYSIIYPDEAHVITNLVITPNQTISTCPENPLALFTCIKNYKYCRDVTSKSFSCNELHQCTKGEIYPHGIATGRCIPHDLHPKGFSICEIRDLILLF